MRKVRLDSLLIGQWFKRDGREGWLVYKNDCRARVKLPGKKVQIKDTEFKTTFEQDWAPGTEVEPLQVFGGPHEEVILE